MPPRSKAKGAECLAALRQRPVISCSPASGYRRFPDRTAARALKAIAPAIPVILLTSWGEQSTIRPADPGLVDRILAKPVCLADLLTAIHKLTIKRADHPAESAQLPD